MLGFGCHASARGANISTKTHANPAAEASGDRDIATNERANRHFARTVTRVPRSEALVAMNRCWGVLKLLLGGYFLCREYHMFLLSFFSPPFACALTTVFYFPIFLTRRTHVMHVAIPINLTHIKGRGYHVPNDTLCADDSLTYMSYSHAHTSARRAARGFGV